jgi:acyl-CoA dehydrogenase
VLLHAIRLSGTGTSGASPVHLAIFWPLPLFRHGSASMKARYLPRLASGELRTSFTVAETTGLDTSRTETRAEQRGDRWVLNGRNAWVSNAQHASKLLLLARISPRAGARPLLGLTLLIAVLGPRACQPTIVDKLGRNAVDSNELVMTDLEVADKDVVGEVGRGSYHLLGSLNAERIAIAMEAIGIGCAALSSATG